MGKIKGPKQVKLFMGIIAASREVLAEALKIAEENYGRIDVRSAVIPFTFTSYYEEEMGKNLLRCWVGFEKTISPEGLADIKVWSNSVEDRFCAEGGDMRSINLDPGYLELSKVVLASTKDFSHRIYIGKGIYAEITLLCKGKGGFTGLQWSYPDYQSPEATKFLTELRNTMK